jgi:glycerol-3-phosphate dehydrogenase (NAD(P)+)
MYYDREPGRVPGQKSLAEIVPLADCVFFCVPSWGMRSAINLVLPYLKPECQIASFSKGIEKESFKTMSELFAELLPNNPFALISGPMLAEEIDKEMGAVGVIGCTDNNLSAQLVALFRSNNFRVETTADIFSVSLAGVLKNVYAFALGIADGLKWDGNQKGWLSAVAIHEMVLIGNALGADQKIILGTAGVADLIATGYSEYSRNRELGMQIVQEGKCTISGEGLSSLEPLIARLKDDADKYPVLSAINSAVIKCQPAKPIFDKLFQN